MTRQEIEGYLLHARTSPETFVLDEQADLLEADIASAVERARLEAKIEALDDLWCATKRYERGRTEECAWMVGVTPYSVRMDVETLAAALAALEVKGE